MPTHKLNLNHLTEDECEKILQVIQRDFDIRNTEKERLSKIEEELKLEDSKTEILSRKKAFNDNCCMRCFSRFIFIFNQKVQCLSCRYYVCKSCALYRKELKEYVCHVCEKQRELLSQSSEWFYRNVKRKFKRFGSAKVVRSLHKRKTDSDSENDAAFQLFTSSLPVGRRPRAGIDDFFSSEVDGRVPTDDEEVVIQQTSARKYIFPKWDELESERDSFETAVEGSVVRFRNQLHNISSEVTQLLEEREALDDVTRKNLDQNYDKGLANHKLQISSALLNFARGLHQAIDSKESDKNQSKNKQTKVIVKEVLHKEIKDYTGSSSSTEQATSGDCSGKSDCSCHKPLVDHFTTVIYKKILDDYKKNLRERLKQEEEDLDYALTKLTNRATVTQLNDLVSESDADHPYSSCLDDSVSEAESKLSDKVLASDNNDSFETAVTSSYRLQAESADSVLEPHEEVWEGSSDTTTTMSRTGKDFVDLNNSYSDLDLDEIVRSNMIEDDWKIVESVQTGFLSTDPKHSKKTLENGLPNGSAIPLAESTQVEIPTEVFSPVEEEDKIQVQEELCAIKENFEVSQPVQRLGSISPTESHSTITDDIDQVDADADEESVAEFLTKKRDNVPLPSLDVESSNEFNDIDFEDFRQSPTYERDSNWRFGGSFKDIPISPYDNCGERKIGSHDGPVYMFVPKGAKTGATIGDRTVDELSDLSENEDRSDSDSSEGEEEPPLHEQYYESMLKSARPLPATIPKNIQTETPLTNGHVEAVPEKPQTSPVKEEKKIISEMDLPPVSTEGEETDPKFVVRPVDVQVMEGDVLKLECQVEGTSPLDVFWYRDMGAVNQLENDDRCDLHQNGSRHSADVFTCVKEDSGHYLCLGINENGQCAQSFKVTIKPNTDDTKAPEFIKSPSDVDAVVGDFVKLRCKVKGLPQPRVVWYKDGKRIVNTGTCKAEKIGNRDYTLTFNYVTLDDDAEYTVVARNIAGEAKVSIQVLVEQGDDAYLSHRSSKRPSSLGDSLMSPDLDSVSVSSAHSSSYIYPDTEELMRVAAQISESQGRIDKTASKMMRSANTMSNIDNELNAMDRRLDDLERNVSKPTDSENNNDLDTIFDTSDLVQEEQRMLNAARNVREVTASALDILSSAENVIDGSSSVPITLTPADPLADPQELNNNDETSSDDEIEVHFTYEEFEKLLEAGKVSYEQRRKGTVKRKELKSIQEFLREHAPEPEEDSSHDIVIDDDYLEPIDCGLKRVDSTRYKRDYVINRGNGNQSKKSLDYQYDYVPPFQREVVKATPAGTKEDARTEMAKQDQANWNTKAGRQEQMYPDTNKDRLTWNKAEEQIYVNAGRVFNLEDKIKSLEASIESMDDTTSPAKMAQMEKEVAQAVAEVQSSEKEVRKVEAQVNLLQQDKDNSASLHPVSANQSTEKRTYPQIFVNESREPWKPTEDDVPADRPDLPSVKKLKSQFDELDEHNLNRDPSVKRVYSLTGRDIPRTVREKLRDQRPSLGAVTNVKSGERNEPAQRSALPQTFKSNEAEKVDKVEPEVKVVSEVKVEVKPEVERKISQVSLHLGDPPKDNVKTDTVDNSLIGKQEPRLTVRKSASPDRDPSSNWSFKTPEPSSQPPSVTPSKSPSLSTHQTQKKSPPSNPKPAASTIMARAAFWDRRINMGESSDGSVSNDFPDMPQSTFRDPFEE